MDGVAVMRALLLAHPPLTALVKDRIVAGVVPQGMELPAVGISEISRPPDLDTVARNGGSLVTARIQVTVHAKSYPQQKALLKATKLGPGVYTGTIAGVAVRSVLADVVGPDLSDEAAGFFQQSRDYKVTYVE
jgi:hypothetical protein